MDRTTAAAVRAGVPLTQTELEHKWLKANGIDFTPEVAEEIAALDQKKPGADLESHKPATFPTGFPQRFQDELQFF